VNTPLADTLDWHDRGDGEAGARMTAALGPRAALPTSFPRVLGAGAAKAVEQDALVRLLDRDRPLLIDAVYTLALSTTIARKLSIEGLRWHLRRCGLAEQHQPVGSFAPLVVGGRELLDGWAGTCQQD
jgi:hypothetical protein